MSPLLLDASAVLAWVFGEAGAAVVEGVLPSALLSAVNASEVRAKADARGVADVDALEDGLHQVGLRVLPFDHTAARACADLASRLHRLGRRPLSLADRACLGTAQVRGIGVLTADRAWATLDLGVEVQLIR